MREEARCDFLDLAKSFTNVPHKRLIEKLEKHGTGGKLKRIILETDYRTEDTGSASLEKCQDG